MKEKFYRVVLIAYGAILVATMLALILRVIIRDELTLSKLFIGLIMITLGLTAIKIGFWRVKTQSQK